MYPYRNRWRWIMFGRYSHLVKAVNQRRRVVQDTVLEQRVASLKTWNLVRFVLSIPLSAGLLATVGSAVVTLVPGEASDVVAGFLAVVTALTGVLSLVYLFLTRLLGQLEVDILAILTLSSKHH